MKGTMIQDTMDLNKDPLDIDNLMENILNSMSYTLPNISVLIAFLYTGILPDQDSEPKQMLHQSEFSSYLGPLSYHGWPNHPLQLLISHNICRCANEGQAKAERRGYEGDQQRKEG